jgi:hypothetical protein
VSIFFCQIAHIAMMTFTSSTTPPPAGPPGRSGQLFGRGARRCPAQRDPDQIARRHGTQLAVPCTARAESPMPHGWLCRGGCATVEVASPCWPARVRLKDPETVLLGKYNVDHIEVPAKRAGNRAGASVEQQA